MSAAPAPELVRRLEQHGQAHVLRFLPELSGAARARLLASVEALDLALIDELAANARTGARAAAVGRFEPPDVLRPRSAPPPERELASLRERGESLLAAGEIAWLLVAGGQASRLGYDGPKGAFPVGPVSDRSLFELFARKLHATRARFGRSVPWYVLTSPANDATSRAFFERHDHFGLPREDVVFFQQAMLPALGEDGRILLAAQDELFLAPNGHGGVLAALASSGALRDARGRGIRRFSYFQVDNPLAPPSDPLFLGLHAARDAQMSSKVVRKRDAAEKVGVIGHADGRLGCIEYSDLPAELREARDVRGELVFGDGNIAMHVLDLEFVDTLTARRFELPWHMARKKMNVLDDRGRLVQREGWKFETFVFDALGLARAAATLEVERAEEFSPVKNAEGQDSPASARADLCRLHAGWVRSAGLALPPADAEGVHPVEVDPCIAQDAAEFRRRAPIAPRTTDRGHLYT